MTGCVLCKNCNKFGTRKHADLCQDGNDGTDATKRFCNFCKSFVGRHNYKRHVQLMHKKLGELDLEEVSINILFVVG